MLSGIQPQPFYTLKQYATLAGFSYSTAKRLADTGEIDRIRIHAGGRLVVPHRELERFMRKLEPKK